MCSAKGAFMLEIGRRNGIIQKEKNCMFEQIEFPNGCGLTLMFVTHL